MMGLVHQLYLYKTVEVSSLLFLTLIVVFFCLSLLLFKVFLRLKMTDSACHATCVLAYLRIVLHTVFYVFGCFCG